LVFVLSAVLGALLGIAANAHGNVWVNIMSRLLLYTAALLASLPVVRSSGYRFARAMRD
jgi:hypothetical protein